MGCVSSFFLSGDNEFRKIGRSSSLPHTVVDLDSRFAKSPRHFTTSKENSNPNRLDQFEKLCPPGGENKVVIYTTTLRGVRKTFQACSAVRAAIEGLGVLVSERDISMDYGFREELKVLMKGKGKRALIPPRVFINGRYIGGDEEVLRIHEEGCLNDLVEGLPRAKIGAICEGCGGNRFLPCFECNGSCKILMAMKEQEVVMRCSQCNENGLVHCPLCS